MKLSSLFCIFNYVKHFQTALNKSAIHFHALNRNFTFFQKKLNAKSIVIKFRKKMTNNLKNG